MALLACIPVTGCLTLAEVAACSLNAADNTFKLDNNVNVVFEDNGGVDILQIGEATRHVAIGPDALVDDISFLYGPGLVARNILTLAEEFTDLTGIDYVNGISNAVLLNPGADFFGVIQGMDAEVVIKAGNIKNVSIVEGVFGGIYHFGSGVIDAAFGLNYSITNTGGGDMSIGAAIYCSVQNNGAGSQIDDAYGLWVDNAFNGGGGVITDNYGVVVGNQAVGTNNWSIQTHSGHVVFNEDSHDDTDFRVEGATNTHLFFTDGSADRIGINDSTPDGKLDIIQSSTTAAIPVVELEQLDLSEEFFNFVGTVATGNPIEAVGAKTLTVTHFVRVAQNGSFLYLPLGTIA